MNTTVHYPWANPVFSSKDLKKAFVAEFQEFVDDMDRHEGGAPSAWQIPGKVSEMTYEELEQAFRIACGWDSYFQKKFCERHGVRIVEVLGVQTESLPRNLPIEGDINVLYVRVLRK